MPLAKKWSAFNKETIRKYEHDFLGIYELGANDDILYIGEGQVKTRLLDHFSGGNSPTPGVSDYRVDYTGSKEMTLRNLRQHGQKKPTRWCVLIPLL